MSIKRDFHVRIRPNPHPFKAKLQKLECSAGAVAQYLGLSYPYVLNMLNGAHPMTKHTEAKIQELIQKVRAEVS